MIMRKIIHLVMRITKYAAVPEVAFESELNAEQYLKKKSDNDKNYHGVLFKVHVEDVD